MKKGNLILVIILLAVINGFSQEKDYQLRYSHSSSVRNENFDLDYQRSESEISIIVKTPLSIDKFNKDDRLKVYRIMEDDKTPWKEKKKLIDQIMPYKRDTLLVKPNKEIVSTVDSFVRNWKRIKSELEKNPDKRIILDGYTIKLSLEKNDKDYRNIYAYSPNAKSHPEIFELISKLEDFYKKESKHALID